MKSTSTHCYGRKHFYRLLPKGLAAHCKLTGAVSLTALRDLLGVFCASCTPRGPANGYRIRSMRHAQAEIAFPGDVPATDVSPVPESATRARFPAMISIAGPTQSRFNPLSTRTGLLSAFQKTSLRSLAPS